MPPNGRDAGDPAAGADDDLAVDLLAEDPVGRADVVGGLGGDVAALTPRPEARIARAASWTTALPVARRCSSERSKRSRASGDADDVLVEDADRLLEELLARLVALEDGDDDGIGHMRRDDSRDRRAGRRSPAPPECLPRRLPLRPSWRTSPAAGAVRRSGPTTASGPASPTPSGARCSAASSTWSRGSSRARTGRPARSWPRTTIPTASAPASAAAPSSGTRASCSCATAGEHRIADAFCGAEHLLEWAKAGGPLGLGDGDGHRAGCGAARSRSSEPSSAVTAAASDRRPPVERLGERAGDGVAEGGAGRRSRSAPTRRPRWPCPAGPGSPSAGWRWRSRAR